MADMTRREFVRASAFAAAGMIWKGAGYQGARLNYNPVYDHSRHYVRDGRFSHSEPSWQELRHGLDFTRLLAYRRGGAVDSMGIVKIDPEYSRFRVFHDFDLKTIEGWQRYTNTDAVFNSSYYQDTREPTGLIITNSRMMGPRVNSRMKGMFVAEPADGRRPRAAVLNLTEDLFDYRNPVWREGVQSFPMLLDRHGNVNARRSNWHANRTVICNDSGDNILVLTTEGGYFSLYDMGLFLRESSLNIRNALNLDGGYEAEMMVKTPRLIYLTYGQWETQTSRDISIPGIHIPIPAVIGVFPR